MAKSDLLISLVRAGASGDKPMLRSTVEALVADERAKSHHALADRLERVLQSVSVTPPSLVTSQRSPQASGKDTVLEITPRITIKRVKEPFSLEGGRETEHLLHCSLIYRIDDSTRGGPRLES
jgi:hypothetical protein